MLLWTEVWFPHKFMCWKSIPQSDGIRRKELWEVIRIRLGHEVIHSITFFFFLFSAMWGYKEESAIYNLEEAFIINQPCWPSDDLRILDSRTVRIWNPELQNFLTVAYKKPSLWYFTIVASAKTHFLAIETNICKECGNVNISLKFWFQLFWKNIKKWNYWVIW